MKTVPNVRRQRGRRAVDLEQVGAIDVAELGRHDAVDEPGQEDDLGRVLRRDARSRCRAAGAPSASRATGSRHRRRGSGEHEQPGWRRGSAPGPWRAAAPLSATKTAMMTSGTAIEMIVRGCRSRRASDICSGVGLDARRSLGVIDGLACVPAAPRDDRDAADRGPGWPPWLAKVRVRRSHRHRPMVLPASRRSWRGRPVGPAVDRCRGARWTPLATGVQRRTT